MSDTTRKLILPGGSGFLGHLLAEWFGSRGWQVVVLSRRAGEIVPHARVVPWDGATRGPWCHELEGATAVVNLAGLSVNCRYNARNRRAIMESRIDSTRVLGAAIAACEHAPQVWLNSSTATIYKHSLEQAMDETSGIIAGTPAVKDVFSVEVAQAWERAAMAVATPATRRVLLRTAMVFSNRAGTVYRVLRRLTRLGLGGAMGDGRQYVSWIHETDFCRAIEWLIAHDEFSGVVNLAAPEPLTNREMMRHMRRVCHMPCGLPASRAMLEIGAAVLRTETELVLKSRRVVPSRLQAAGFEFCFADLGNAVDELVQHERAKRTFVLPSKTVGDARLKIV
jgi:uncharacterized protein (TIGR01777 family)